MRLRLLARLALIVGVIVGAQGCFAQVTSQPVASPATPRPTGSGQAIAARPASSRATAGEAGSTYTYPTPTLPKPDCNGAPCDQPQQPHIVVTLPAPAPVQWTLHEKIAWAAMIVLAIVGYIGVMLAIATLRKIERNTAAAETSANAAAETAQASLLHAQALVNAERPWLMISVEPVAGAESSFNVMATNRGKSPARVVSLLAQILSAEDEEHLPAAPSWTEVEAITPAPPIVLLPGESVSVKAVKREEAAAMAGSAEKFKAIEAWEQRLYICGRVTYKNLLTPDGKESHTTDWCCWYIHGRQRSGLALAGPPAFHAHT